MLRQDDYTTIRIDIADGIAVLTLNRPEVKNAVSNAMHTELSTIFQAAQADPNVNVVVVTGAGNTFSLGGEAAEERDFAQGVREAGAIIEGLVRIEKPVIAAVNGDAIGLGATIASLADVSFMEERGRFGDPHVPSGLTAGNGSAVIWPLLIGINKTKELLLRGAILSASDTVHLGLLSHLVPDGEALTAAMDVARELNRLDPFAVRTTKVTVNRYLVEGCESVLRLGLAYEETAFGRPAFKEALASAIARRRAKDAGKPA